MNRTQIVSTVALSASYNLPGNGEIVDANSNDVLYKAQADTSESRVGMLKLRHTGP
jgi:hypothetical protein